MSYIGEVKARKGVIRTTISTEGGKWTVTITGDFMIFPEEVIYKLERNLSEGCKTLEFYVQNIKKTLSDVELFGCSIEDFIESFKRAYEGAFREC